MVVSVICSRSCRFRSRGRLFVVKHFVSYSGGKDSTAMLLRLVELGEPVDAVFFADTGLEYPEMYPWIEKISTLVPCGVTTVRAERTFFDWFYGVPKRGKRAAQGLIRGFPPEFFHCRWQREGKDYPLSKAIGRGNVVYIGIAADEAKRANATRYKKGDNEYRFPLIEWGWTEADCFKYLESRGLSHPLRFKFKRTGCWLCPKQSLDSLRSLHDNYPELWARLKKLEADSPNGFKARLRLSDFEASIAKV